MTEKQSPLHLSMNLPKPVRLLRPLTDAHTSQEQETPPELPQYGEPECNSNMLTDVLIPLSELEECTATSDSSISNLLTRPIPVTPRPEIEISSYPTLKITAVKSIDVHENRTATKPGNSATAGTIYGGNTAYDRRLARKRRIEEKKLSWKDLQQFGQFITPFKWQIGLAFALTVIVGLMALPLPFIFHILLDQVFPLHNMSLFAWILAIVLVVLVLTELFSYLNRNVLGMLSRSTNLNITYRFYRHMLRLPLSFYQGLMSTGQLLSRLNEVTSAQQAVIQVLINIAVNGILTIIYVAVLFLTNWKLTLAVIIVAPFYLGVSFYFNRRFRKFSREMLESYAVMNGAMYEGLTGLKTIKALAAEHRFGRKTKRLIMITNDASYKSTLYQSKANLVIGLVQAFCAVIVLSFGGYLVLTASITAGALAAFILILRQLMSPVTTLNGANQQIQSSAVAIDRLFEILNQPEEAETEKGLELRTVRGEVKMNHVSFSYEPGNEVLHDITLDVAAGSTIALVGRSGAGKTTISNLLMRFYQPDSGFITIDGYDLRDLKIESLRSQFGVILQDDSLFSGTIKENLTFGLLRKVSYAEMEEAARNANILDYIQSLPLGFETMLHERGQSLSGGQRQRISIARMFLRQPKILIMDEPSSALDNESEFLIQQALKRLSSGRTTFIIAHRLSTIRNADRIIVINDGCVVEQGSHEELLSFKGTYWHLYNSYGRM
jgi:subfamily B ATP-binding cassette protein MsbA